MKVTFLEIGYVGLVQPIVLVGCWA